MKDNRNFDLSDIKKLKDDFNNLKEKIKNTLTEKKELLQSKCEVGFKNATDFINIHKADAGTALKTAMLTGLICAVATFQFQATMHEEGQKASSQLPVENTIVMENTDYGFDLASPSDVIKIDKDFFGALDETKNIVEEMQKLAKGISTVQKTREYTSNGRVEKSSLEDKYQLINAIAEKLKQNRKECA